MAAASLPEAVISRAELAVLLAKALGLPEGGGHANFRDVNDTSWYSSAVASVQAYGLMSGFKDGTFGPKREVTRQEAIVTLVRALQLTDAGSAASYNGGEVDLSDYSDRSQIGSWANDAMRIAIHNGLVKGYGTELRPQQSLTRAEATALIYRMLQNAGFINEQA